MMGLFEHWPYVNFHDLNLDWVIKKIKNVETAEANSQASAEASADSAAASQLSADASQQSADASQQSADSSQESANASAASELSAKNYADHIADPVSGLVTGWLDDHVTPTTPIVDDTLTISGAAADAKKTGDEITDLKSSLNNYLVNDNDGKQSFYGFGNFQHYGISESGEFITNQKYRVSNNDPMTFDRDLNISVDTGFRWGYIPYANGTWGSWTGWYTSDRLIKEGTSFIVQIARVTEDTSETADVSEFLNAVTFETVTAINTRRIAENGISSVDIKSYLGIELGGLTAEGKDNNYMPWRLRSLLNILPYDITITKNNGYQFKVYTFSDAEMNNPVDSGWYTSDGATLNIPKNTYFRVMLVDTNNDLAHIEITDVKNSDIYNNAFIYRTGWIYPAIVEVKSLIPKVNAIKSFNPCFVSMAHQGYSTTEQYHGNNRISSYIGAFKKGFDTAETDIQFSSDNVPMCCHDASFIDSVSGITIVIAEHTAQELQTYNYYGEHIATLDEVMSVCKTYGLRLELDKVLPSWTDNQWNAVFDVVSKYQMQKYVLWTLPYNTNATLNKILAYDKYATIILNLQNADLISNYVAWIRTVITDNCTIILAMLHTIVSVDDIINLNKSIPERNIGIMVWTIDDLATYQSYAPYVWGIASNKLCIKDAMF